MNNVINRQVDILNELFNLVISSIDDFDYFVAEFDYDYDYEDGSCSTGVSIVYFIGGEKKSKAIINMKLASQLIRELHAVMKGHTNGDWKKFILTLDENGKVHTKFIYEE